jgi:hypothetical protein
MSVLEPTLLERFTLRIRKSHTANPSVVWYNTYELQVIAAVDLPDLKTFCTNVVEYEAMLHRPTTKFESFTISTHAPDGEPYNPSSFVTVPLTNTGGNGSGLDQAAPLHICWRVAVETPVGRLGFRLYRNCLSEGDVHAPAGLPVLENPIAMSVLLDGAISGGPIDGMISGGASPVQMVLIGRLGGIRFVEAITSAGITVKKLNNRYFDRVP